jgi:hypothetical protein
MEWLRGLNFRTTDKGWSSASVRPHARDGLAFAPLCDLPGSYDLCFVVEDLVFLEWSPWKVDA